MIAYYQYIYIILLRIASPTRHFFLSSIHTSSCRAVHLYSLLTLWIHQNWGLSFHTRGTWVVSSVLLFLCCFSNVLVHALWHLPTDFLRVFTRTRLLAYRARGCSALQHNIRSFSKVVEQNYHLTNSVRVLCFPPLSTLVLSAFLVCARVVYSFPMNSFLEAIYVFSLHCLLWLKGPMCLLFTGEEYFLFQPRRRFAVFFWKVELCPSLAQFFSIGHQEQYKKNVWKTSY